VWEHFKESFKDGAKRIICNSCHTEFPPSESGSTGHLHLHLKKCGNNEDSKNKQKGDDEVREILSIMSIFLELWSMKLFFFFFSLRKPELFNKFIMACTSSL
jgi:hypothetical protein